MSPVPADRYATAEDMALELERYLTYPQRMRRLVGLSCAAMLLLGAGVALWSAGHAGPQVAPTPAPRIEAPPALEMVISRGGQSLELVNALPLKPESDLVQLIARIPQGHHAMLVHVNANGKVKVLPFRQSPGAGHTTIQYPAADNTRQSFEQNLPGTEVVFVFAAENPDAFDQLEELIGVRLGKLPAMPAGAKPVWLTPEEVPLQARTTPFGEGKVDPVATVETRLNDLRLSLLERGTKLSLFRGVAYTRP